MTVSNRKMNVLPLPFTVWQQRCYSDVGILISPFASPIRRHHGTLYFVPTMLLAITFFLEAANFIFVLFLVRYHRNFRWSRKNSLIYGIFELHYRWVHKANQMIYMVIHFKLLEASPYFLSSVLHCPRYECTSSSSISVLPIKEIPARYILLRFDCPIYLYT